MTTVSTQTLPEMTKATFIQDVLMSKATRLTDRIIANMIPTFEGIEIQTDEWIGLVDLQCAFIAHFESDRIQQFLKYHKSEDRFPMYEKALQRAVARILESSDDFGVKYGIVMKRLDASLEWLYLRVRSEFPECVEIPSNEERQHFQQSITKVPQGGMLPKSTTIHVNWNETYAEMFALKEVVIKHLELVHDIVSNVFHQDESNLTHWKHLVTEEVYQESESNEAW